MEEPTYYTAAEAAAILKVDVQTVWRWRRDGLITAHQVGGNTYRFTRAQIDAAVRPVTAQQGRPKKRRP